MAKRDITGLLTGIPSGGFDPMVGLSNTQALNLIAAQGREQLGGAVRGLLGGDRRTPTDLAIEQQKIESTQQRLAEAREQSRMTAFSTFLAKKYPDSGLDKLAAQGIVTPDNLKSFLAESKGSDMRQGGRYTVRDSEGNIFAATTAFSNDTASFETKYAPLGKSTSVEPVGAIEILTKEGVTFQEKEDIKIKTADQIGNDDEFREARMGALGAKFEIEENLIGLNETLSLLKSVDTGGPIANISGSITKFLGTTPADREELEFRLASRVLSNLKSTFGGAITEGERQYLIDISANIKKGNKGNRAIIENLKEIQERAKKRNDLLLSARNFEEYNDVILGYGFEDITADSEGDKTKVRYEDLD
jgi:hypothetical protein